MSGATVIGVHWRDTVDSALAESKRTGRPALLDFFHPG